MKLFQKSESKIRTAFDIDNYKLLSTYLTCLGINPYQNDKLSNAIVGAILIGSLGIFCPTTMQLIDASRDRDLDGIIEDLPLMITGFVAIMKVLNLRSNKTRFRRLFDSIIRGWDLLESKGELRMLQEFTVHGDKLAALYRHTLLTFLAIFVSTPMLNPVLDIVAPLNETRPRRHIFKVDYIILDEYEHFYTAYVHMASSAAFVVFVIISVDSLYIMIIHHACGLFAVCGYQVQQAAEKNSLEKDMTNAYNGTYEEFKECVTMHYDAILFYDTLERCCRNLYLIQMTLNMLIISLTAVEVIMYLSRLEELIRAVVFLIAQQFHLYVVSLPGQVLLDESMALGDKIYASKWYQMPVTVQRDLYKMQIRCNRPCILTAGGLYAMNIENFGITVKTCISYMTMFLSLRE